MTLNDYLDAIAVLRQCGDQTRLSDTAFIQLQTARREIHPRLFRQGAQIANAGFLRHQGCFCIRKERQRHLIILQGCNPPCESDRFNYQFNHNCDDGRSRRGRWLSLKGLQQRTRQDAKTCHNACLFCGVDRRRRDGGWSHLCLRVYVISDGCGCLSNLLRTKRTIKKPVDAAKTIAAVGATQGNWLLNKVMYMEPSKIYSRFLKLPLYVIFVRIQETSNPTCVKILRLKKGEFFTVFTQACLT